uniref:Uncharacterized protein n=1 Tax=Rangifer tarandus platyrhynchus TaxID=3082113 RepID=A0ACB0F3Q1_RANTA|nr:unnamed protein product [Rangifer tarandus platyrhynchus]
MWGQTSLHSGWGYGAGKPGSGASGTIRGPPSGSSAPPQNTKYLDDVEPEPGLDVALSTFDLAHRACCPPYVYYHIVKKATGYKGLSEGSGRWTRAKPTIVRHLCTVTVHSCMFVTKSERLGRGHVYPGSVGRDHRSRVEQCGRESWAPEGGS